MLGGLGERAGRLGHLGEEDGGLWYGEPVDKGEHWEGDDQPRLGIIDLVLVRTLCIYVKIMKRYFV